MLMTSAVSMHVTVTMVGVTVTKVSPRDKTSH